MKKETKIIIAVVAVLIVVALVADYLWWNKLLFKSNTTDENNYASAPASSIPAFVANEDPADWTKEDGTPEKLTYEGSTYSPINGVWTKVS